MTVGNAHSIHPNMNWFTRFLDRCRKRPPQPLYPDTPSFSRGFKTPFNCPMGVVHQVYKAEPCGEHGIVHMAWEVKNGEIVPTDRVTEEEIKGVMYSITAEIEVLVKERDMAETLAFAEDAMAYLAANPHRATKRVVTTAWVTDDDLIKQEIT